MLNMVAARARTRCGACRHQPYEHGPHLVAFSAAHLILAQASSETVRIRLLGSTLRAHPRVKPSSSCDPPWSI